MKKIYLLYEYDQHSNADRMMGLYSVLRKIADVKIVDLQRYTALYKHVKLSTTEIITINSLFDLNYEEQVQEVQFILRYAFLLNKELNFKNNLVSFGSSYLSPVVQFLAQNNQVIFDIATPYPEEIAQNNQLAKTKKEALITFFSQQEPAAIAAATITTAHHHSYLQFLHKKYGNFESVAADTGSWSRYLPPHSPQNQISDNQNRSGIAYVGSTVGDWVDQQQLAMVTEYYKQKITIFSGNTNDTLSPLTKQKFLPRSQLHRQLQKYKYGLIILKKSRHRINGFSAKIMAYAEAGLPTLVPKWYKPSTEIRNFCIPYHLDVITGKLQFTNKEWSKKSRYAKNFAATHTWSTNHKPLKEYIRRNYLLR